MVDPGSEQDCYCLILLEDQPIGEVSSHRFDSETRGADLNIKIEAEHRGCGYATDALETFCRFFFRAGGERLTDRIAPDNVKGQRALLSFGFEHNSSDTEVFLGDMTRERFQRLYWDNGTQ
jgi:RimJ/RimL family protein N-acetyltransferase